jgi:serine/threonine protein kinase
VALETSACLDEQTLASFVSGDLDSDDLHRVEDHLAGCADCRGVVADAAHGANEPASFQTQSQIGDWPQPGEVLAEKYRIEALLGRGGMGLVFGAQHIELGHRVAIKVLESKDPLAAARFLREAKTCAQLINDHIVRVFDLGRLPNGVPYFVMEHLRGRDLGSRIARERLPVHLAVQYLLQVCAALKEAHAVGVIHRDLKPSNLFLVERSDGKPLLKVLDFGISKLVSTRLNHTPQPTLTLPDAVLGSPSYMSPEQVRGSKALDARSDIWSLGVIAYELLTQHRPFRAHTMSATLIAIVTDQPPRPSSLVPDLPPELEALVLRCLEKDAETRFANVDEVIEALSPFSVPVVALAPLPSLRARWPRRWWLPSLAVGLICVGGWALRSHSSASVAAPSAEPNIASLQPAPGLQLAVHCDLPLPAGMIRWLPAAGGPVLGSAWSVERLCEAQGSADRRAELLSALGAAPGSPAAALEPPHPFYSLSIQRTPERLSIELRHESRARVALELTGARCSIVERVVVHEPGPAGRVLAMSAPLGAGANPCERSVELPFDEYGKRLGLRLQPSTQIANDVDFQSPRITVSVQPATTPPIKASSVKRPSQKAVPSKDCLPPKEFCRK